jgi:4,5-dihydroxyphthalate decarboxylase
MTGPAITLLTYDHDHYAPLAMGDVAAEGIDLRLVRRTLAEVKRDPDRLFNDPTVDAGELSFSRHVIQLSQGDDRIVGMPIFAVRAFCHRMFFVKRGSPLRELNDLKGKRIGTSDWQGSGVVWGRAALHDAGVRTQDCEWWVGTTDGSIPAPAAPLPRNARFVRADQTLSQMLIAGELDAILIPGQPAGFYESDSQIVRLLPDYVASELDYFSRTRIYPGAHIIGVKRHVFERNPQIARSLFKVLETSKLRWDESRRREGMSSPWMLFDLERVRTLMGLDWRPYGVEPNRHMVATFCAEELDQAVITTPVDPEVIFAEFEQATRDSTDTDTVMRRTRQVA